MFGYVIVNKPEMKIKDFDLYQSFYCGLCETLKQTYGRTGQMSLNFDMTFLILMLSGLYEPSLHTAQSRCVMHPMKQHTSTTNVWSEYGADMTILLTYLKCQDDLADDHKLSSNLMSHALRHKYEQVKERYAKKVKIIEDALAANARLEQKQCSDLDQLASLTGVMMGEIFTPKEDEWTSTLYTFGDYLGRFIYLMDAYDDLKEDKEKQRFNPLLTYESREDFEDWIKEILEMTIATSATAFEKLPIILYTDMIRNILYSGVWAKYDAVRRKRSGDNDARPV